MGALQRDDGGCWRYLIRFRGTRSPIRLGHDLTERQARASGGHIDAMADARDSGAALTPATAAWLTSIGDKLHARLVVLELCEPRTVIRATVGELIDTFNKTVRVKPGTAAAYKQGLDSLAEHFGRDRALASITPMDADGWRRSLSESKPAQATRSKRTQTARTLAPATQSKRTQTARNVFGKAVRWGMIPASPFVGVKAGKQTNPDRQRFIDRPTIRRVLDACPDAEWRLLVGLSRFAGLRCPSEHLALTWPDWDIARGALTVRAAKTGTTRTVPVDPELAALLQTAFDQAEPGATWIITRYRLRNCNLRTMLRRIVERAGVEKWPQTWHNLRASAQTEWSERFPLASVCRWIGNTPSVAASHYLTARDAAFDAAVKGDGPAVPPAVPQGRERPGGAVKPVPVGVANEPVFPDDSRECDETVGSPGTELEFAL